MLIKLCFSFMYAFTFLNPHVASCFFPISLLIRVVQILPQTGLLEVHANHLSFLGYFSCSAFGVLNGRSSKKANAK
jgi:hypothetical protein